MITVGQIKTVLAQLDGCTFSNQEELEDAVLPRFGQLQSAMLGKTHRDLVDLLVDRGWVKKISRGGAITLKFPPEPATINPMSETVQEISDKIDTLDRDRQSKKIADTSPTGPIAEPTRPFDFNNLSFREIALLVQLHTNGVLRQDLGFNSLIAKGLVESADLSDKVTELESETIKQNIAAVKTQVVSAIFNNEFNMAFRLTEELRDAQRYLDYTDIVFRLTSAGKAYMQDKPDSVFNEIT